MHVIYTGKNDKEAPLAFLASSDDDGPEADVAVMDEDGAWTLHKKVARRGADSPDGKGHTWRKA